ncbi:GNAT family N-acetyltransferase [Mangrovibacillus cuniculi]|uniref:GNAT family N-acetyltransferase n=1 Tax=Mangrovibacillus cuniculi TaxID=2593652 RepID=A0A7S8CEL0_9BACI|nr:GNAT family N-acetyltransferase [Mangrovibacillus cuniculi]
MLSFQFVNQLLQTAINWAKEKRVKEIYLGTKPMFLAAHRFYEKNGFVSISQEQLPKDFPVMKVDKKFYMYTIR